MRKESRHHIHERLHVEAFRGRHDDLVVKVHELARGFDLLEHLLGAREVGLGKNEHFGCLGGSHALGHPCVATTDGRARVDHERDHVNVRKLSQGALVELGAQAVLGLVDTGRVHNDELAVLAIHHRTQAAAGRLRHR